jgi:xanthosine utilization system XapX-like protein
MRRRQAIVRVTWALGLVLVLAGLVLWELHRSSDTWVSDSVRTVGSITAVTATPRGSGGPSITIGVQFATPNGESHRGSIEVGRTSRLFSVGAPVDLVYDRADPSRVAVRGATPDTSQVPWSVPVAIGVGFLAIGVVGARRVRWEARLLGDNPWVVAASEIVEMPQVFGARQRATRALRLTGAPEMSTVVAAPAGIRSPAMVEFAPQAWVAGSGRRFVVAAPGGAPLLRMQRLPSAPRRPDPQGPML